MHPFLRKWGSRAGLLLCAGVLPVSVLFASSVPADGLDLAFALSQEEGLRAQSSSEIPPSSRLPESSEESPDSSEEASSEEGSSQKEPAAPIVKDIQGRAKPVTTPSQNATRPKTDPAPPAATGVQLKIPYVSQLPNYPTGCEAASAAMLLQFYGYPVGISEMVNAIPRQDLYRENGKVYGPDITKAFVGDPTQTYTNPRPGYGVFSPALTRSIQQVVDRHGGGNLVQNISGCSFDDLLKILDSGHPLIVWATYRMKVPAQVNAWYIKNGDGTDRYFEYPRETHVMILSGYDSNTVTTVDPYGAGVLKFDRQTFYDRWVLLGRQAIVMYEKKGGEEPSSSSEPSSSESSGSGPSSEPPSSEPIPSEEISLPDETSLPDESEAAKPEESGSSGMDSHQPEG